MDPTIQTLLFAGIAITAVSSVVASIVAMINASLVYINNRKLSKVSDDIHELRTGIDSRFSQLLASEGARLRAEGVLEGQGRSPSAAGTEATRNAEQTSETAHQVTHIPEC